MSYRSYADLGGEEGCGRVVPQPEGEVFHADWERQVFGLTCAICATGAVSGARARSYRETLPDYRSLSYYEIWMRGIEKVLIDDGFVSSDEIAEGRMLLPARPVPAVLRAADVSAMFAGAMSAPRTSVTPARFSLGEWVRTRKSKVHHYTRLPNYTRGKTGRIERICGVYPLPDANVQGLGEQYEPLYTVVFAGRELWGSEAAQDIEVSIDAWESYLERLS